MIDLPSVYTAGFSLCHDTTKGHRFGAVLTANKGKDNAQANKTKQYLSQYLINLRHKICFTISFISCLYMFRAHVLIIRRSKLHYTASGIITPQVG